VIKISEQIRIEGPYLNTMQAICKTYRKHHTKWGKAKIFDCSLRSGTKHRYLLPPLSFNIVLEVLRAVK
jgi:hypothetical protein